MTAPLLIASDHAGFALKQSLIAWLREQGYAPEDLGTCDETSVDYPDFGYKLAQAIAGGKAARGIVICGSGIGISIAANRHPAIRCALCHDGLCAELARRHNDANVLALGARLIGEETAKDCVMCFLNTDFEGGRHAARVEKLSNPRFTQEPA